MNRNDFDQNFDFIQIFFFNNKKVIYKKNILISYRIIILKNVLNLNLYYLFVYNINFLKNVTFLSLLFILILYQRIIILKINSIYFPNQFVSII